MTSRARKDLWRSASIFVLCVAFLCYAFTRKDPWHEVGAKGIAGAVIGALISFIFVVYPLLPAKAHPWFERAVVGLLAAAATTCTILFGSALWAYRATLGEDFGLFGFMAVIAAVAFGASALAWWALFRQFKNRK